MEQVAGWEQWLLHAALLAGACLGVWGAWLLWPSRRMSTASASLILPYSRETVWRAYFAACRMRTPGLTFETAMPGTAIEFTATVGEDDLATCTMTATVTVCEPFRRYAARIHTFDGQPFPGGPNSLDGLMLEDSQDGTGTIATVFLHLETPSRLHIHFLRKSVVLTLQKMQCRLDGKATDIGAALAPA